MFRELKFGIGSGDFDRARELIESNYPRKAQDIFDDLTAAQERRFAGLRANSDKAAGLRDEIGGLRLTIKLAEADRETHADKWTPEHQSNLERKRSRLIKLQEQVVELTTRPSEPPLDPYTNE